MNADSSMPKYIMIKKHLQMLLIKGEIPFGEKLPSEYSLMEKFSVSRHTIRQALNELENDGLIFKEQGKGSFSKYVESEIQRNIVAVITTYVSDYIFPEIISGIEEVLSKKGYPMLLYITNSYKEKERQCLNNILEHGVTGLIIDPSQSAIGNENYPIFDQIKQKGVKTVFMNAGYDDISSSVIVDDKKGAYLATQYLIEQGHKKIAGFFKTDDIQGVKRKKGFLSAFESNGIKADNDLIGEFDSFTKYEFPYSFTKKLLIMEDKPTAVVCYNDEIAALVVSVANEMELFIPEDLSIVGFDDSSLATMNTLSLTSVSHPKKDMGITAAKFLVDMLDGKSKNPKKVYEPKLILRDSCKKND
jgi:GntR family transcriptional regulator, arabinose operon transcriptional repressor